MDYGRRSNHRPVELRGSDAGRESGLRRAHGLRYANGSSIASRSTCSTMPHRMERHVSRLRSAFYASFHNNVFESSGDSRYESLWFNGGEFKRSNAATDFNEFDFGFDELKFDGQLVYRSNSGNHLRHLELGVGRRSRGLGGSSNDDGGQTIMAQDSFETIVLVAAVGFIGWYVYENYYATPATPAATPATGSAGSTGSTTTQTPATSGGVNQTPTPTLVCPVGYSVSGTSCVQQASAGSACTSNAGCASGLCSNGVCAGGAVAGLGRIVVNSMGAYV